MEESKKLGANLGFAATEAYKLLRTNLLFSFTDDKKCHVVGITSSLRGEGKSTTSINIAYMMAETGRKVLLIEADMRLPTAAKRLGIKSAPGLSNLLVAQCTPQQAIQRSGLHEKLFVMTSGDIPPNPSELLGSNGMTTILRGYSESFDYIIVDLPPVTAVSDALVISHITDGLVMVVSKDFCSRSALAESMTQLGNVKAKVLGFVMTRGDAPGTGKYKKYYKHGKYGKDYSYSYRQPEKK